MSDNYEGQERGEVIDPVFEVETHILNAYAALCKARRTVAATHPELPPEPIPQYIVDALVHFAYLGHIRSANVLGMEEIVLENGKRWEYQPAKIHISKPPVTPILERIGAQPPGTITDIPAEYIAESGRPTQSEA